MADVNLSLPTAMKDWIEGQTQSGRYTDAGDYIRDLIRQDQIRRGKIEDMQRLVDEALESGGQRRKYGGHTPCHAGRGGIALEIPAHQEGSRRYRPCLPRGKAPLRSRAGEQYHTYLESVFQLLGENPELARERSEISPPVRIHPCGSHLVVYIKEGDGGISILRVRHFRENWLS